VTPQFCIIRPERRDPGEGYRVMVILEDNGDRLFIAELTKRHAPFAPIELVRASDIERIILDPEAVPTA
jgi:hypothetical protein